MFVKKKYTKIPVFERKDQNSKVYKNKARILMFGRIKSEFQ